MIHCLLRRLAAMRLVHIGCVMLSCSSAVVAEPVAATQQAQGCVVLVHGLMGSRWNWVGMRSLLERSGYQVQFVRYPSREQRIEVSAQALLPAIANCQQHGASVVHLVGHSMGGLLIRQYLQQYGDVGIGRVVMLGTPNQGSELSDDRPSARGLPQSVVASWLGPAVPQLTTAPDGFIARLAAPRVPTGIIAGHLTPTPWLNSRFKTANDGLVAVYSTRLAQMQDFLLLPVVHSSLPLNVDAQRQTLWFLNSGYFYRP